MLLWRNAGSSRADDSAVAGWRRRVPQRRVAIITVLTVLLVGVGLPTWTVFRRSFQAADAGFTLRWYREILSPSGLEVLWDTAVLVVSSGLLAVVLGLLLAWMVERIDVPFTLLARLVPVFPLLIPGVMGAAVWAFLLSPSAGYINVLFREISGTSATTGPINIYSMAGVVFVTTLYTVPFTFTVFYPAFRSMDSSLEEAAYVSGASFFTAARTVTFGLVRPALLGALVVAFTLAISQFTIPEMLGRSAGIEVLTARIYRYMQSTFPANVGGATATAMAAVIPSLLLLALQYRLLRRGSFAVIGGKGSARRRATRPLLRWIGGAVLLTYGTVAFVLPLLALVHVSLSPYWTGRLGLSNLTLDNFRYVFYDYPHTWPAIQQSVTIALQAATVSVLLAFAVAYLSVRSRVRGVKLLDLVSLIPAAVPTTVFGVGFLLTFINPPIVLYGTGWLLLLAYIVIFVPYAVRPISASIRQVQPELEDAARMSGDTWLGALRRVSFPLVLTSMVVSWTLLFIILSREVNASVFLVGAGVRLVGPTIFDLWNNGSAQYLAAFSLLIVAVSSVVVGFAEWVSRRDDRSHRRRSRRPTVEALR